jgi:hypothetical protein
MKAQVLHKYDPEMKEKVWVTEQEMPEPKLEKSSDVIVKIEDMRLCLGSLNGSRLVEIHLNQLSEISSPILFEVIPLFFRILLNSLFAEFKFCISHLRSL